MAVKAPLFNSRAVAPHVCYWSIFRRRHSKFVRDSWEKRCVCNLDLSAVLMHLSSHVCLLRSGLFTARSFQPPRPPTCVLFIKSGGCVPVRLMSIYATLFHGCVSEAQRQWSPKQGRGLHVASLSAAALWALWRADLFPPDCPLCRSNVRSSWVTSPPPPPLISLTLCQRFASLSGQRWPPQSAAMAAASCLHGGRRALLCYSMFQAMERS